MEDNSSDISSIDVFELAGSIGKEFEKIIHRYGSDAVSTLMAKVITTLEHLEYLTKKTEHENNIVEELNSRIEKLEYDKHMRNIERMKYEKEMEQIDEEYRKDHSNLLSLVNKLQEENKRLASTINQTVDQDSALGSEIDDGLINQLQNQVDHLREKIKLQNNEMSDHNMEIDNLRSQIETLKGVVLEHKRKHKLHNTQISELIDEKTKLMIETQDYRREIHSLQQKLGSIKRENEDLRMNDKSPCKNIQEGEDQDDTPRFTVSELKEILHDRNDLKARLNDLQDELALFKVEASIEASELDSCFAEEELPVQGPLPPEPDDAPWKKSSDTGIRKLFRKFFGEYPNSSPVRRILSTDPTTQQNSS